jgi:hypothetical protein
MDKSLIDINFFPMQAINFEFLVYLQKCKSDLQKCSDFNFETKRFNLAIESENNREKYFVTIESQDNFIQQKINSDNNVWLTQWYLFKQLCLNAKKKNIPIFISYKYDKNIDVVIKSTNIGNKVISIIPKYLCGQYGYLINYHFKKNRDIPSTREIQKLSLSLDSSGKPNKNYYLDKYDKIVSFVNSNTFTLLTQLENVTKNESPPTMLQIEGNRLSAKKYLFAECKSNTSQFKGIENYGPYQTYSGNPILCFVYQNKNKDLSHILYYALQGKTYPTFNGMEKMFGFTMNKENIIGISINDYSESEINKLVNEIKIKASDRPVIPIILVPWIKETATEEESRIYYMMKHHFIKNNIASQFVGIPRVESYDSLKWSVSSIGLQIFTKLGGSPWCMESVTNKCLIIGIGQSHKRNKHINKIEKYFSYSILTDSTGIFMNIKVLSENHDKEEYLNGLSNKLKEIIKENISNFKNVVIHTSFKLQDSEINKINEVVNDLYNETKKEFIVIRFSNDHDYMSFNLSANSKTPFESTIIKLNKNEFLIWFEGLSSSNFTIKTRIGPPMHLIIDYPKPDKLFEIRHNLQDAINLSGANWRGFNAKTTPISILYARLLSSYLAAFDNYEFESVNIEQLTPWFL